MSCTSRAKPRYRYCIESVLEIRRFLTDVLASGGVAGDLAGHLRAMRAGCRKFLDEMGDLDGGADGWHRQH